MRERISVEIINRLDSKTHYHSGKRVHEMLGIKEKYTTWMRNNVYHLQLISTMYTVDRETKDTLLSDVALYIICSKIKTNKAQNIALYLLDKDLYIKMERLGYSFKVTKDFLEKYTRQELKTWIWELQQ